LERSLDGKTIVITGSTSGIGLALAQLAVMKGALVVGIGRSKERCIAVLSLMNDEIVLVDEEDEWQITCRSRRQYSFSIGKQCTPSK